MALLRRSTLTSSATVAWVVSSSAATLVTAFAQSASAQDATPTAPVAPVAPQPPPHYSDIAAPLAVPPPSAQPSLFELSTLRILHEKGLLSDKEFEAIMQDAGNSTGAHAAESTTVMMGKWATTLYGFLEEDNIYDTTQSLVDLSGNNPIARAGTYAGDNDRMQMSVRNTRFGFRFKAPEYHDIRVGGQAEFDFLGTELPVCYANQPSTSATAPTTGSQCGSEATWYTAPVLRARHLNLKVETPVVDLLMGQYFTLFGWHAAYAPGTAELQGVPGELYARTPQVQLSKTFSSEDVTFEMAIAALRPPQRDSATPEGQAGMRLAVNNWKGVQTIGSAATSVQPASIAITGDLKNVRLPGYPAPTTANYTQSKVGGGIAVDAFLPLIPGHRGKMGNSLSFTIEAVKGYGIADQYTQLTGGNVIPTPPNPMKANPAPSYAQDIDNGIVTFDAQGNLQYIEWHSVMLGLQYYLPGTAGKVFVTTNFSYIGSDNNDTFTNVAAASKLRLKEFWGDACLFTDVTPAFRLGLEYANFHDVYGDGVVAVNHRGQFTGLFLF
jgi:hypothetical protein